MDLKNKKIAAVLVVAVLIVLAIAIGAGIIQLPKPSAIQTQEQASEAIGDIGSGIEKIESTISGIEGALK